VDSRLIEAIQRARAAAYDSGRPEAVERVHGRGRLTARERIAALLDPGSEVELGILRARREDEWLPTLGGVDFTGTVDGHPVIASSTDYSHHGGGYGAGNLAHLFALAREHRWPVVLFADGGGSQAQRPDGPREPVESLRGRHDGTIGFFEALIELAGWAPSAAMVSGPSYAGHATLAASCDFIVATRGSSIGMGGPPMVEAAFGIRVRPEELGPVEMHAQIGGIDLLVDDEPAAIAAIRTYLSFQHDLPSGEAPPTAGTIGALAPEEGKYDMRPVIEALVDGGSFFELRRAFAGSLITGFARMDGRAAGILANQPASAEEGAIDQDAANKIARFVQVCDAYALPLVSLVDTPGFVIRREGEPVVPGTTRHHARPIRAHHHRRVPLIEVQIRRTGGPAAAAMTGIGRTHSLPLLRLAWPTVERRGSDRYAHSLHDVIDPAETRDRIIRMLRLVRRPPPEAREKRMRDSW
jgi:acetyl-CoA carboxylase carboxyltransferase component